MPPKNCTKTSKRSFNPLISIIKSGPQHLESRLGIYAICMYLGCFLCLIGTGATLIVGSPNGWWLFLLAGFIIIMVSLFMAHRRDMNSPDLTDPIRHETTLHRRNKAYDAMHHLEIQKFANAHLSSKRSYRQFEASQRQEALGYLREIVRKSHAKEIMILDPYLAADDIMNILYFSTEFGRRLRAIGCALAEKPASSAPSLWSRDPRYNNKGLNIEFRIQHSDFGGPLLDRFLLFPGSAEDNTPPTAISIGTSYNSVGKCGHIIAALQDAQGIIDDFETLWKTLSDPSCLIYKHPKG